MIISLALLKIYALVFKVLRNKEHKTLLVTPTIASLAVLLTRKLGVRTRICTLVTNCEMERTVVQLNKDVVILNNLGSTESWTARLLMTLN